MENYFVHQLVFCFLLIVISFFIKNYRKNLQRFALVYLIIIIGSYISLYIQNVYIKLPINENIKFLMFTGPGGGMVGLLPLVIIIIVSGKYLFKKSIKEQFGIGKSKVISYGILVGLFISIFALLLAYFTNSGEIYFKFSYLLLLINLFSNLYEEIIFRGLLLQITKEAFGQKFAIVFTSILFGLAHGFNAFGIFVAVISMGFAWVILKTKNLFSGWIAHSVSDFLIDSFLH